MNKKQSKNFFTIFLFFMLFFTFQSNAGQDNTIGWVEHTKLKDHGAKVKMKIDTGALTSSMHAKNIETFTKNEKEWVRFEVSLLDEETNETKSEFFEREVFRNIIVKGAGGRDRRQVVLMTICVGDTYYEEQFSLRDRTGFIYPLLIGRRAIQHWGLVDVTRTFSRPPECTPDSDFVAYSNREDSSSKIGL